MAGTTSTIEFDSTDALRKINMVAAQLTIVYPMLRNMGDYLITSHMRRFEKQISPDGTPWKALSPRYLKTKRKNKDKILQFNGYLKNNMRYQVENDELLFGSDRPYAAIHQFGGDINIAARSQQAYFNQKKDGSIGQLFVKKKKSNFAQWVTIGAYKIQMPARPFLGTSEADNNELVAIAQRHLERQTNS